MKYSPIDNSLFIENRKRFASKLTPNSIAIFHSNDQMPRNGDCFHPFRQNSHLFYLSGIDQEESILVLFPDCPKPEFRELLFLKKTNEFIAIWEGHKYTQVEATETSGVQKVFWLEDMDNILNELILLAEHVYVNDNENDRYTSPINSASKRAIKALQERYPTHSFKRAQPIIKQLVMIKSQQEIALMEQAVEITDKAFKRVLQFIKPDVWEYEIEAEITHEFLRNRATGHAYEPIVGSGHNACVLHYIENKGQCKSGDLILMDFGAEYANYAADLTRTIPVSGRFTPRQKDVYNAVLHVKDEATKMLRPGITLSDYQKEVGKIMEEQLIGLKLLDRTDVKNQNPKAPLYRQYFMHGTSHHIGLDVHDLSDRYTTLKAGMVLTCEPGIYIQKESIGIRIENDIVVTDNEPIDLMKNLNTPESVEAIESWMNQ